MLLSLVSITSACFLWQVRWIAPYTRLWRSEVPGGTQPDGSRRLRVMTANVLTSNRQAEQFLELVRRYEPDVLCTLESDAWWQSRLDRLEDVMPHSVKCPLDNLYGMHVYSRFPLDDAEVTFLVEDDVPSIHALVVLPGGPAVRAHFLHPAPPSPTQNPEATERDAELVIVARSIEGSDQPVIVTGDLNDVAWSPTTRLFRKLSGLLDPRVGRGMFNTFHAAYPFLRWPLDHLFHSGHFSVVRIERLPAFGSDHFALFTELEYGADQGDSSASLQPDQADREWADEIADEVAARREDVPTPGE